MKPEGSSGASSQKSHILVSNKAERMMDRGFIGAYSKTFPVWWFGTGILFFHSVGNFITPIETWLVGGFGGLEHAFFPFNWGFHHPIDELRFFRG